MTRRTLATAVREQWQAVLQAVATAMSIGAICLLAYVEWFVR